MKTALTGFFLVCALVTAIVFVRYTMQVALPQRRNRARLMAVHVATISLSYMIFQFYAWLNVMELLPEPRGWALATAGFVTGLAALVVILAHLHAHGKL